MAYLLTWTTYGTWLHGDERGSVDDRHNLPTRPVIAPNDVLQRTHSRRMRDDPFILDRRGREIVYQAIVDHASIRTWRVLALNVRTNHVHAVMGAATHDPEQIVGQLKSWSTRRRRSAGMIGPDRPVWTRQASTRWLWDDASVAHATRYVLHDQDRAARFD